MRRYNANTAKDMVEDEAGEFVRWEDACLAIQKAYNLGFAEGSSKRDGDGEVVWCYQTLDRGRRNECEP